MVDHRPSTADQPGEHADRAFYRLFRDLACICGFDGTLHWVSPSWEELLDRRPTARLNQHFLEFVHPEDRESARAAVRQAVSAGQPPDQIETRWRATDGSYRWLLWSYEVDHAAETVYAVAKDVTTARVTEARLVDSEARYRLLAEHSTDVITVSSRDGAFTYVSPASRAVFGWEPGELIGHEVYEFIHPHDVEGVRASLHRILSGREVVTLAARFRRADDTYRWLESTGQQIVDPLTGEVVAVIGNTRDITQRQRTEAALVQQAVTDPLTGIPNRILLLDQLQNALLRLDREPGLVAVLLVDLDRFKVVNDSFGHDIGDAVLIEVARRLVSACRSTDGVARLGGDEFVVLAEGLHTGHDVDELARRLVAVLRAPIDMEGVGAGPVRHSLIVTASVGVAVTSSPRQQPEELMRGADLALYRAKAGGRDRHAWFDDELRASARRRSGTEQLLRRALADQALVLRFQPVLRMADKKIVGAEALLRVIDPAGTELPAAEFLDVAEDTGLIQELEAWVIDHGLSDHAGLMEIDPTLSLMVNISTRNLGDPTFPDHVEQALATRGLPASALMLEMTEQVLLQATHSSLTGLRQLRDIGVVIGMDDFGTGYASLAWLRNFPLDFLKVDQAFLKDALPGSTNIAILRAIVDLAHALSLTVVAEGIAEPDQLTAAQEVGCDRGQGWLLGQPLSAADYRLLLRSRLNAGTGAARKHLEPPVGVEPTTYSLRVNRSTD